MYNLGDSQTSWFLNVIALLAGYIDAIAGGGGMLVMPALLSIGMPPHLVLGTNKLVGTFGTLSASLTFIRQGLFSPASWREMALGTFAGALVGALLIYAISPHVLKKLLPLVIMGVAIHLLWPHRTAAIGKSLRPHPKRSFKLLTGAALGFYDGFIGPGTGAFWMAVAFRFLHQDLVRAAGVARFMNFMSNAASLSAFIALSSVDYKVGLSMGVALMLGAFLGAHSAIRYGSPFIRTVLIGVVLLMAGRLAIKEFFQAT